MIELNKLDCVEAGIANTGHGKCPVSPDAFVGAAVVPPTFDIIVNTDGTCTLYGEDYDTVHEALQAAVVEEPAKRIYPIWKFDEVADNSEQLTVNTSGYGTKKPGREGDYEWSFTLLEAGMCFQKRLRTLNNLKGYKVVFFDKQHVMWGTQNLTNNGLKGYSYSYIHAEKLKINDGSKDAIYVWRVSLYKPEELNDNFSFLKLEVDPEESVKGNIDVTVTQLATSSGHVIVGVKTRCDDTDLYETYADDMAVEGAFVCKDSGGTVIDLGSVTKDNALKGWNLAGAGIATVSLATPKALAALGVGGGSESGFESDTLTVV